MLPIKVDRAVLLSSPDFWGPMAIVLFYGLLLLWGQVRSVHAWLASMLPSIWCNVAMVLTTNSLSLDSSHELGLYAVAHGLVLHLPIGTNAGRRHYVLAECRCHRLLAPATGTRLHRALVRIARVARVARQGMPIKMHARSLSLSLSGLPSAGWLTHQITSRLRARRGPPSLRAPG